VVPSGISAIDEFVPGMEKNNIISIFTAFKMKEC
jgi:hypothetical protein